MFQLILKALGIARDITDAQRDFGKQWWKSKTLWVNALAVISIVAQMKAGFIISADDQLAILAVVNLVLRVITTSPLIASKPEAGNDEKPSQDGHNIPGVTTGQ